MHDIRYPIKIIDGIPVVTPPEQIDLTTGHQLRLALLHAAAYGHTTIVVDMTGTRFCDSAGLTVLAHAHKRARAEGGELRLVIPADGAVFRVFTLTGLDLVIARFESVEEALRHRSATAVVLPLKPRRLRSPARLPRPDPEA